MSPNKIAMLLRLHVYCRPFDGMPAGQIYSQDTIDMFGYFRVHGLLADGVTHATVVRSPRFVEGAEADNLLTEKGVRLVDTLCSINPQDVP